MAYAGISVQSRWTFVEEMGDQVERNRKLRSVDQVEIPTQPSYLGCVNIFFYLYRKSLLCNKHLHSLEINNSLNVLCSKTTTPLFILTEKYARFLHTELTVWTSINHQKQEGNVSLACRLPPAFLRSWRWRRYVPLRRSAVSELQVVTTQKTVLFITVLFNW
jgi:hypothetical protein